MKINKIPKLRQYAVINCWDQSESHESTWFELHDSIENIINEHGQVDIYRVEFKKIGKFKKSTRIVRVKSRKRKTVEK